MYHHNQPYDYQSYQQPQQQPPSYHEEPASAASSTSQPSRRPSQSAAPQQHQTQPQIPYHTPPPPPQSASYPPPQFAAYSGQWDAWGQPYHPSFTQQPPQAQPPPPPPSQPSTSQYSASSATRPAQVQLQQQPHTHSSRPDPALEHSRSVYTSSVPQQSQSRRDQDASPPHAAIPQSTASPPGVSPVDFSQLFDTYKSIIQASPYTHPSYNQPGTLRAPPDRAAVERMLLAATYGQNLLQAGLQGHPQHHNPLPHSAAPSAPELPPSHPVSTPVPIQAVTVGHGSTGSSTAQPSVPARQHTFVQESVSSVIVKEQTSPTLVPATANTKSKARRDSTSANAATGTSATGSSSKPSSPHTSNKRQKGEESGATENQKCLGCGATSTPEWRRGPMGPRTLCNACGLVYAKMMKRRQRDGGGSGAGGNVSSPTAGPSSTGTGFPS